MSSELFKHIEKALVHFTAGDFRDQLIEAKKFFFEVTGQLNDDDEDFESRLNSFNDWYIFNYKKDGKSPIYYYVRDEKITGDNRAALENVNYSLFEFTGTSLRKNLVLKDILHDKKIQLPKDHPPLALLKSDLFIGRVVKYEGHNYLLNGICTLPKEVRGILKKESKKIRKQNDSIKEIEFLLHLESLKTKSMRYGHLTPDKIFVFNK